MNFYKLYINDELKLYELFLPKFIKQLSEYNITYTINALRLLLKKSNILFGIYKLSYGNIPDNLLLKHKEEQRNKRCASMLKCYNKNKPKYNAYHSKYVKNNNARLRIYQRLRYLKDHNKLLVNETIPNLTTRILNNPTTIIYNDKSIIKIMKYDNIDNNKHNT